MESDIRSRMNAPIFLVGFMCSGKSTFGKALAARLEVDFIDLDDYIVTRCGRSVSEIFRDEGEVGFRRIEAEALQNVLNSHEATCAVIALGGGTPCREGVMETLAEKGVTVHLDAPIERLVERLILGAAQRPLIAGKTPSEIKAFVEKSLSARNPFYSRALHTFDSSLLETEAQISQSVSRFINQILS